MPRSLNPLGAAAARRRYLLLHALRWLPTGLTIPVLVLLPLERGLSLAEYGAAAAAQGIVVLLLELPTGGLADAIGRRPVLLLSAVVSLVALGLYAVADTAGLFLIVYALTGVFRALDSGPLEAWYVDTALAADERADIESGLSRGSAVVGLAIAFGAAAGGGLVALGPIGPVSALTVPVLAALVVQAAGLVAIALLLVEPRTQSNASRLRASLRGVPMAIGGAVRLALRSRVVLALISVELFWGFGMATFETLMPVRLAEVLSNPERAGAVMGPTASAGWVASSVGAALVPLLVRRVGAPWAGALLRLAQGATVVGMGLLAGPVGVIGAYLLCYAVHGAANPVHSGLLHRQVEGPYRGSLISLNSMVSQPAGALGLIVLTAIAEARTVSVALVVGATVLAAAAPLYLVARGSTATAPAVDRRVDQ